MKDSKLCTNCKKRPALFTAVKYRKTNMGRTRYIGKIKRDNKHPYCRQCQQSFRDRTQTNKPNRKLRK